MAFSAKNLDLADLVPPTVTITIGDYEADFVVESAVKSNKTLLTGAADSNSIKVTKATVKQATSPNADALTVMGTFTIAGSYDKTNDFAVTVGAQTFTIAGSKMVTNAKKHTESCAKVLCNEGGLLTAKFDFAKHAFTLTLTGINLPPGKLTFGISVFGKYLGGAYINDNFVGTRTVTSYGDDNLGDGFALVKQNFKIVASTSNNIDYTIKISGSGGRATFSMARQSATQLALNPQPQNVSTYIVPNVYMLSDGSNGAFLMTGKDPGPLDLSIGVSTWTRPVKITGAQLAGQWTITWIFDDNLLDNMMAPFGTEDETFTITDMGGGQVRVQGDSIDWTMKIVKNSLVPVGSIDPTIKYLSMVTDGDGISMTMINVDPLDDTNVGAKIGLGARLP
jgi:hypothetical protein